MFLLVLQGEKRSMWKRCHRDSSQAENTGNPYLGKFFWWSLAPSSFSDSKLHSYYGGSGKASSCHRWLHFPRWFHLFVVALCCHYFFYIFFYFSPPRAPLSYWILLGRRPHFIPFVFYHRIWKMLKFFWWSNHLLEYFLFFLSCVFASCFIPAFQKIRGSISCAKR